MDEKSPIQMLENDHRKVEKLFTDYRVTEDDEEKKSIVEKTCDELTVHAKIEEEHFYPELESVSEEGRQLVEEAKKEHQDMKDLIEMIKNQSGDYEDNFKELEDVVNHHVREEEDRVFPFAQENIGEKLDATMSAKFLAIKGKEKISNII